MTIEEAHYIEELEENCNQFSEQLATAKEDVAARDREIGALRNLLDREMAAREQTSYELDQASQRVSDLFKENSDLRTELREWTS